jgi:fructose-bisphosphate aldolase class 1
LDVGCPDVSGAGLVKTAQALVGGGRGLLAMDESTPTCNKRFAATGIAQTEAMRRAWRELMITTPGLRDCISGAILYDETIRQSDPEGTPFVERLAAVGSYRASRWISARKTSHSILARRSQKASMAAGPLERLFQHGRTFCQVASGHRLGREPSPAAVAGVAFLSGGQAGELASARLNAMNIRGSQHPWPLVFSFARTIQRPALDIWHGLEANVATAQDALHHRAQCNHAALRGEYTAAMEHGSALRAT